LGESDVLRLVIDVLAVTGPEFEEVAADADAEVNDDPALGG